MALTKSGIKQDWVEIAQNALTEGVTIDVSGNYDTPLVIQMALSTVTAHTGTKVIIEVSGESSGDDAWSELLPPFIELIATAKKVNCDQNSSGSTLYVDSTTDFETKGDRYFVEDTNDVTKCEIVRNNGFSNDDYITTLDAITDQKDSDDDVFDTVAELPVYIPFGWSRARVLYDNTYDADGSTVHARVIGGKVIALS